MPMSLRSEQSMENQSHSNNSHFDSRNSTPRSREFDCENKSWDEQPKKVKLMCSYGGKIQPRRHDNRLSYMGGDTKILTVDRYIKFEAFITKLSGLCGSESMVCFKYQLPGEDLDALISVTNDEDLENMMLEYDRSLKPARLRLFLWFVEDFNSVEECGYGKGGQPVEEVGGQVLTHFDIQGQVNELQRMQISGQEHVVYQHSSNGMVPVQSRIPLYWQDQSQMMVGGYQVTAGGAGVEQPQQVYIIPAPGGVYQDSTNYGQMSGHDGEAHTQAQAYYGTQRLIPETYRQQRVYSSVSGLVVQNIQQPTFSLYAEEVGGPQLSEDGHAVAYDATGTQVYYTATAAGGNVAPTYQVIPAAATLPVTRFATVNQEGNATNPYAN